MPFNVNCEAVRSDLQIELIELQSNNYLKQSFLNMPKLEFYKSLSKGPKNMVLNSIEKDKNPNDRQNDRDKKQKDTGKPQSWNPNAENKYKNPAERGNPFRGGKEDQCNCQCAA
ncbi:hypothetical protein AVEN_252168-1 [Araneus ventricosus]|uniref:Uncharacterized protein n=1 Tax=Araneus ventricosus TaxID=182803 RepID=A0A4Y2Q015_ARAVE|nr:hypothetical protein AVEN_252168-1 [Araneus ventricosus]